MFPKVSFSGEEIIEVETLDSFHLPTTFNFLFLDVQGYELEVLKGASETLKHINWIFLEFSKIELYKEQPLLEDLDVFLKEYKRIFNSQGKHGNAIYIRRTSAQ